MIWPHPFIKFQAYFGMHFVKYTSDMKGWVLIFGELYAIGKIYTKLNLKFMLFMGFSVTDYWILTSAFDFEEPQKEGMETHSNAFAWRIPWTEETGGLQSIGSKRVRHNSATKSFTSTTVGSLLHFFSCYYWVGQKVHLGFS